MECTRVATSIKVDVRTLFALNLALIGVREQLFQATRQQAQQWRNIRVRLALLFKALYDTDVRVICRVSSLVQTETVECAPFHTAVCADIARCMSVMAATSGVAPAESVLSDWLNELGSVLDRIYAHAGYCYTVQTVADTA